MMVKGVLFPGRCRRIATGVVLMGLAAGPFGAALAQDMGPMMDRLDRLERDIRTLNIRMSHGGGAAGADAQISAGGGADAGVSRLTARLDSLEQDIRASTGSMEQLGHQIRQMTERLDKLVSDVDFRLSALEAKLGGAPGMAPAQVAPPAAAGDAPVTPSSIQGSPVSPPGVAQAAAAPQAAGAAPAPNSLGTISASKLEAFKAEAPAPVQKVVPQQTAAATPLPAGTVKEKYTYALNLLRQTNYDQAEIALTEFVAQHGDDSLAGNARYWLGETYYVRADYEQAAQTFFQGYQASPDNSKAPDMLLKLGMSLTQLKKSTEACATFDKLAGDFPDASIRIANALDRERKRAGCR